MAEAEFHADHVFDGGDMDCGSGLILLIRQQMLQVPEGGIMELRSREPTVAVELPPWCRMVGHECLASVEAPPGQWRHWVRRGVPQAVETASLEEDKRKALHYEWRLRGRHTGNQETTVYARNFSWKLGQSVSFEEADDLPSALEGALGALLAELVNGFARRCVQRGLAIDELEGNLRATLENVLAHLGMEQGDPSLKRIALTVFITSPAAGGDLRGAWEETLQGAPLYRTLAKACEIEARLAIL